MCQVSADRPGSFTNNGFQIGATVAQGQVLGSINFFGNDFPQKACAAGTIATAIDSQNVDRGDLLFTISVPASLPDV